MPGYKIRLKHTTLASGYRLGDTVPKRHHTNRLTDRPSPLKSLGPPLLRESALLHKRNGDNRLLLLAAERLPTSRALTDIAVLFRSDERTRQTLVAKYVT